MKKVRLGELSSILGVGEWKSDRNVNERNHRQ